jgi:ubiquinone/menaquinone biosynthesis C-methylase UbiE
MSDFQEKFKHAVKNNFNLSLCNYVDLENKHSYFVSLTKQLLDQIDLPANWPPEPTIVDVGCGTGSSVVQLRQSFPTAKIYGLDISENMLSEARDQFPDIEFTCGDGEALPEYYPAGQFDLVIYPASLFLMPDQEKSLTGAYQLLKPGGIAAASILLGLKEKNQQPLEKLPEFKGIIKNEDLPEVFGKLFQRVKTLKIQIELDEKLAGDIYKIEALSAGAFPGKPYEERVQALKELILEVRQKNLQLVQEWTLIVGYKE